MDHKPPAFQLYAKDWRSSENIAQMSLKQIGVYITMLVAAWDSEQPGSLPLPIEVAAKSARLDVRSVRDLVSKFPRCWIEVERRLINPKLSSQYKQLQEFQKKQSDAGKLGNEKRWSKTSQPDSGRDRSASAIAFASATAKHIPPNGGNGNCWRADPEWPQPPTEDGHTVTESWSRVVLAVSKGGKWCDPQVTH